MANQTKNWLIYSGMAIEMFAIIGVFSFVGVQIDQRTHTSPLFTLILILFGLALAFYLIFKQLNQLK
ncbi:MAG: AtpZ/AtpI family protein [Chitinophagales bacterium]|nr:AtpZ/AtpI family protein [Chitinophagales bacterium]